MSEVKKRKDGVWARRIGVISLVLVSGLFSFLNAGERVTLNMGVTTLYRISLVGLIFIAFLLGMLTMFLFGLRQDRRVRRALQAQQVGPRYAEPIPYDRPPESAV